MAFGFNPAQFQQATAIDPAAGALPMPQNLPAVIPQQPQAQPAPQAAPQGAGPDSLPAPPQWGHRGWFGDLLDNMLLGGAIQHTRADEYQRAVQDYQNAMGRRQALMGLDAAQQATDPQERTYGMADPLGYLKTLGDRFKPITAKADESVYFGGPNGPRRTAPKAVVDNGRIGEFDPDNGGYRELGNTGPQIAVQGDVGVDTRGLMGRGVPLFSVGKFNVVGPGQKGGYQTPPISMAQGIDGPAPQGAPQLNLPNPRPGPVTLAAPQPRATPPAVGAQNAPPPNVPLAIRQNNFGALRALPNGQQWDGQVGVGPGGHVIFDTPENGLRASLMNLRNKQAMHGLSTLGDIIAAPGVGWDPGNAAYAHTVSGLTGIPVNQPVDLSDPATLGRVADGIFSVESGPQAWAAYKASQGGAAHRANGAASPSAQPPPSLSSGAMTGGVVGKPEKVAGLPGEYQLHPDGSLSHIDGTGLTTKDAMEMGKSIREDKSYLAAQESGRAFQSMLELAAQRPGGMRAYALRDTFARTINPGAVARVGTIEAIKQSQGIPAAVQAYLMNLKGDGNVPPQIVRQIIEAAAPFAKTAWGQANALNERFAGVAKRNGLDPDLATAPMDEPPMTPVQVRTPDEARKLPPGAPFWTPDGRLGFNHKAGASK